MPDGIKVIDTGTFSGCRALETLTIPNSVESIADWAIEKTGLKVIYVSWESLEDVEIKTWAFGDSNDRFSFVWKIPQSLADVYGNTWWQCPVAIDLDEDMVLCGGVAYKVLDADEKTAEVIALPKESEDAEQVRYTGTLTIAANVPIGDEIYAVKKIGNNSLRDAPELTAVIIPNGLEVIGNSSFASNTGLTSMQLPASVNSIEDWAFYGCSNLESINIPDGITAITEHTFQNSGLTSIELPTSVTSLKVCAFQDASNLASINIENITELVGWSLAGTALTSVIVPDGIKVIDTGTFSGCSVLETLTIPNSVEKIEDWAIEKTGVKEIYISWENTEDVEIKYWAFGDASDRFTWVWMIPEELEEVYGDFWWDCPVRVIGRSGVKFISDVAIKLLSENGAIRIVDGNNLNGTVNVYSLSGANLYTYNGQINNTIVELPAGVYVVKIASAEGVITGKVIVR